ncbi:MAG: polymer-forming cytoskeletal protein [Lachnospiraceae bacterium]|nr:polymer-forming cytoskeletal protein [Lachnospiraceae bacterium]
MGKSDEYKSGRVSSVIGKKTVVEGTLKGYELLRIDGLVKGKVVSDGKVIIGRGGMVEGIVEAVEIYVGGTINGELFASEKVEANPTGEIYGDIHTKRLIVDDNAVFEGRCEMTSNAKSAEEKAPAKKRRSPAKSKAEDTEEKTEVVVEKISE